MAQVLSSNAPEIINHYKQKVEGLLSNYNFLSDQVSRLE